MSDNGPGTKRAGKKDLPSEAKPEQAPPSQRSRQTDPTPPDERSEPLKQWCKATDRQDWGELTPCVLSKLYEQLTAPLPNEAIERTDGNKTGKRYDTTGYGYQYVVDRLNEVLGPSHWRTLQTMTVGQGTPKRPHAVLCELTLQLGNWLTGGTFQVVAERTCYGGHLAAEAGDAYKGAWTNAFKKTAALFGVGAAAYRGTIDDDNVPAPAGDGPGADDVDAPDVFGPVTPQPTPQATKPRADLDELLALINEHNISDDQQSSWLTFFKVGSLAELTQPQVDAICIKIKASKLKGA